MLIDEIVISLKIIIYNYYVRKMYLLVVKKHAGRALFNE